MRLSGNLLIKQFTMYTNKISGNQLPLDPLHSTKDERATFNLSRNIPFTMSANQTALAVPKPGGGPETAVREKLFRSLSLKKSTSTVSSGAK